MDSQLDTACPVNLIKVRFVPSVSIVLREYKWFRARNSGHSESEALSSMMPSIMLQLMTRIACRAKAYYEM